MDLAIKTLEKESSDIFDYIQSKQVVIENRTKELEDLKSDLEKLRKKLRSLQEGIDCLKAIQKATKEG